MKDKKSVIGFSYAWEGIRFVIKSERNFRIHLFAAILVLIAGLILQISLIEWIIIVILIGMVLITEMLNTVVEQMIDYMKPEVHPAAKQIKDIAAGAVLIASMIAAIIGCLVFIPKIVLLM
ncbi:MULTISPECIES: diacylglycerol kinase family protein [Clostridia]|uniref:diacylglycerol kinase family protein n=1 Tax=Clostridia TaxID=186801 RepID=UPI002570C388|nr:MULTISPECIES: diacylglycerol kinase family protein [Clostridia]